MGGVAAILFIVFSLSEVFVSFFFPSHAEKFTSTHATLMAGSKRIVVFHLREPPDDFKVRAGINHGAFRYYAPRIPTPGQAGDTSLALWPGQTDLNLWHSGPESLVFFLHLDSNSDSPYSWICSWRHGANILQDLFAFLE